MERELICIGCPLGCRMIVTVTGQNNRQILTVSGNTCRKGAQYAKKEITNPTRIVTSTVRVSGGESRVVPVKTEKDIPKDKIFACIREIKSLLIKAPVRIGDVIIQNVAGTGVGVIVSKNCGTEESI